MSQDIELNNLEGAEKRPTTVTTDDLSSHRASNSAAATLFDYPHLPTYIGTWMIFLGSISLLVSGIFLGDHIDEATWLNAAALVVVTLGAQFYAVTSFVNQQLLICYGANILFIGLCLFTASALWEGHDIRRNVHNDDPEEYEDNVEARAKLSIAATVTIVVAVCCFVVKGYQRFVIPHFGPPNYNVFGAFIFGAGACCHLVAQIKLADEDLREDDDQYKPHPNTGIFGSYLLVIGALLLVLAVSRSHYALDQLVLSNYPSITVYKIPTFATFLLVLVSGLGFIGSVVLVCGRAFVSFSDRIKLITAALALLAFSCGGVWVISAVSAVHPKKELSRKSLSILLKGTSLQFMSYLLYCISMGLRLSLLDHTGSNGGSAKDGDSSRSTYPDDLSTAAAALGIISSVLLLADGLTYTNFRVHLIVPGNFAALSHIAHLGGSICVFLFCLRRNLSNDEGGSRQEAVSYDGTEMLGYILWSISRLFSFLFYNVALDFYQIRQNEDLSFRGLLKKCGLYRDYDVIAANLPKKERSLRTHSQRFASSFGPKEYEVNSGVEDEIEALELPEESILTTDVVVIGCGPVGLTLCNEIGQRGVRVIGVEMRPAVIPDSRFFVLSTASMEGLKRNGVSKLVLERAIPQEFGLGAVFTTGMSQEDGELVAGAHGEPRSRLESLGASLTDKARSSTLSSMWAEQQPQRCMQSIQEQSSKEIAEANPNITLMYGHEAISMDSDASGVTIKIKKVKADADESEDQFAYIKCKYLVGCDGPGSFVSKSLQVKFDGFANLGVTRTILFKAPGLIDVVRKKYGEVLQYQVARPGLGIGFFVLNDYHKQIWTFNLFGLIDGRNPRALPKEEMYAVLQDFVGENIETSVIGDNGWFWNLFFARSFVYGRVLLCGDAAHSWPPFGGLGGNTGYADAFNLGWKLAAAVKGWGSSGGLLASYNYERREAGLRTLLFVLHLTIDREMLLRAAKIVSYRWLWWTIRWRWLFGNRGTHSANHFLTNGISLGIRYHSNLIHLDEENQDVAPVENTPSEYIPSIGPGCRVPHIKFTDGQSMNDLVAFDGYTLLVVDASVIVTDSTAASSYSHTSDPQLISDGMKKPLVKEIIMHFSQRNIPLTVVDISSKLASVGSAQAEVVSLYKRQGVLLVRPDLYILWNLCATVESISTFDILHVAETACCEVNKEVIISESKSTAEFLTRRFISNIQGYRSLHVNAIYFENADKNAVMKSIAMKAKTAVVGLNTKIVNSSEHADSNEAQTNKPQKYTAVQVNPPDAEDETSAAVLIDEAPSVEVEHASPTEHNDDAVNSSLLSPSADAKHPSSPSSRTEATARMNRVAFTQPPIRDNRRRASALKRGASGASSAGVESISGDGGDSSSGLLGVAETEEA